MHFKRISRKSCTVLDDNVAAEYQETRLFTYGWSLQFGWTGSSLIFLASVMWLLLAKMMRYNQLNFF